MTNQLAKTTPAGTLATTLTNLGESLKPSLGNIANRCAVGVSRVDAVLVGMQAPVRSLPVPEVAAFLSMELEVLANQYGNRQKIGDEVLGECLELVITRFKHLGLNEIREAYRMWAAGDFGDLGAAEMYGGVYQARHLGAILTAYSLKRRKIFSEIDKEADRILREQQEKDSHAAKQQAADAQFIDHIEELRGKVESWEDVPQFWYDMARRLGLFEFTSEEAYAILEEARKLAVKGISNELAAGVKGDRRRYLMNILNPDSEKGVQALETRAKVIARKLTVFRKLGLEKPVEESEEVVSNTEI